MISIDDLQAVRADVLKSNPPARSDAVLARKLFRLKIRELGSAYENAAFDRCFDSLTLRERRDEQPARPTPRPMVYVPPSQPQPSQPQPSQPQPTPLQRAARFDAGKSKYERAKDGILAMRFPNGRDILNQTVEDIQKLGTWAGAILRALPKSAKLTDRIGKYLSLDQVAKLRTFEV